MTASKFQLTRRQILAGASALPLFSIGTRSAQPPLLSAITACWSSCRRPAPC